MCSCNFDCFYYSWKMNLPCDINWLNDEEDEEDEEIFITVKKKGLKKKFIIDE